VNIGFVLFPNVTQLDLTGPLQVLHRVPGARIHVVAKSVDPVPSDCGLSLVPTTSFVDCPPLDILCVPGGFGVSQAVADLQTMDFVRMQGHGARYVTSVCTGAFVLGVAGLLQGKKATTHWAYHALLSEVGAIPTKGRVVRDGNVITGGGVTAGIDFAFAVAAEVAGADVARAIQLAIEYDPAPPASFEEAKTSAESVVGGFYANRTASFAEELKSARRAQQSNTQS
jgi:cyclohexyl-isocyanide hydratase